jgi:hypothetical protein
VLPLLVGIWFQVYFTPFIRVLFTFPSRYLFTIGQLRVFSLRGWSPYIQTGFHVSRPTRRHLCFLRIQDYHLLWCGFPSTSTSYTNAIGLIRVRSPLLTESRLISFPSGTEMFHFPEFAFYSYVFRIKYLLYDPLFVSSSEELKTKNKSKGGFPHSEIFGLTGVDT